MKKYYIYRIEFPNGQFYIGKTSQVFVWMRWANHIETVTRHKHNNKNIQEIYDDYGCHSWKFEVLLELESDDSCYVSLMENTCIMDHPNTVNLRTVTKPVRIGVKRKDDPKAYYKAYRKEWDIQNSYSKKYYQKNKDKLKEYYQSNKERISKKYYDNKVVDKEVVD